jgi:murein DD-endopeptidase MepM/ murein hydrolase activator NlpD
MAGLFDPLKSDQHWLTQGFSATHLANDVAVVNGSILRAAESGRVFAADWNADGWGIGGGFCLIIDHSSRLRTLYAHNMRLVVAKNDIVLRGQVVGYTDTTGNSTGPHMHFGVRVDDTWMDPRNFFPKGSSYPDANGSMVDRQVLNCTTRIMGSKSDPVAIRKRPYYGDNAVATITTHRLLWRRRRVNGGDPHRDGRNEWIEVWWHGDWRFVWAPHTETI